MVDVVEASFDVPFNGPLIREPTFSSRRSAYRHGLQEHSEVLERPVGRLCRTETVRAGIEIPLENRLQDVLHRCLYDPVLDGGDTKGAKLPGLSWLGNEHAPNRTGPVGPRAKFCSELLDECTNPIGQDFPHRPSVHACRTTPAVTRHSSNGHPQIAQVCYQSPQLAENVVGILKTSSVQLLSLALEPALVELRRHIHGFPQRLGSHTHLLPPFAMRAAFPRSDYYGDSVPHWRHRWTWQLAEGSHLGAPIEVPVFQRETHGAVGGRICPWPCGPSLLRAKENGVPICGYTQSLGTKTARL